VQLGERAIVGMTARHLLGIFAEARARSRSVPRALREAVLARDDRCVYCGATADLHLDHVHPFSRGGTTTADNLQVLCASCNIRKGAIPDEVARRRLSRTAGQTGSMRRRA
jgi:5-methylcytosine-specific restriction endonuclease McrA